MLLLQPWDKHTWSCTHPHIWYLQQQPPPPNIRKPLRLPSSLRCWAPPMHVCLVVLAVRNTLYAADADRIQIHTLARWEALQPTAAPASPLAPFQNNMEKALDAKPVPTTTGLENGPTVSAIVQSLARALPSSSRLVQPSTQPSRPVRSPTQPRQRPTPPAIEAARVALPPVPPTQQPVAPPSQALMPVAPPTQASSNAAHAIQALSKAGPPTEALSKAGSSTQDLTDADPPPPTRQQPTATMPAPAPTPTETLRNAAIPLPPPDQQVLPLPTLVARSAQLLNHPQSSSSLCCKAHTTP